MGLTQKTTTIKKDSIGFFIIVSGKRIRFDKELGVIPTPVNISKTKYLGDYRAFDGIEKGNQITLAIYDK